MWLEDNPAWSYTLSRHEEYLEKKWQVELLIQEVNDGKFTVNGRGNTPHEATIDAFILADIPSPGEAPPRTSIFDRNLNPAGPDRFT